jgi:anti-sigma factor RsiW
MTAQVIDWTTAMTTKRHSAPRAAKSCEQLSTDLSAYFDSELDGADRAAMELHLSECEACGKKLEQMRTLRSAMTRLSAAMPRGGSVLDLLKAELRKEAPAKTASGRRTR